MLFRYIKLLLLHLFHFLLLLVEPKSCNSLSQHLCSSHITGLHRSYMLVRPSASHQYSHPRTCTYSDFSLNIETTGSRSSTRKPRSDSRHLYAGCRPYSNQVSYGLIPGYGNAPGFDNIHWITTRQQWFGVTRLSDPHLPRIDSWRFTSTLTTTAHYRSSLKWFGTCS